jgi:hypothetical protein
LVELTEAASRAADDGVLRPGMIAAAMADSALNDAPAQDRAAGAETPPPDSAETLQGVSGGDSGQVPSPELVSQGQPRPAGRKKEMSATCELRASDSTAEMAAKIAKACQARALDDIKVSLDAALDYAADLADRRASSSDIAKGGEPGGADADGATAAATEYQAEALALMQANVAATLDYTQKLLGAKSSAEVVELSSSLARRQCELLLEQTRALRSFTRNVTKSG